MDLGDAGNVATAGFSDLHGGQLMKCSSRASPQLGPSAMESLPTSLSIVRGDVVAEIATLKELDGGPMLVAGSQTLVRS